MESRKAGKVISSAWTESGDRLVLSAGIRMCSAAKILRGERKAWRRRA